MRELDFALVPGAQIRGQVVARADGKPVAGALVEASGSRGGVRAVATTDATGAFALRGLHAGAVSLTARGRGYATTAPTVVDIGIGEATEGVRVVVDRAYTIAGHVVRRGKPGEPIAGVHVSAFSMAAKASVEARVPTGSDGYFEMHGARPASYLIAAMGDGVMAEIGKNVEIADHDVTDVVVEMSVGATLRGRVDPPAVATLTIMPETVGLGNLMEAARSAMLGATSDATGSFTMSHVPPGTLSLAARATDGSEGKLPVTVAADADQDGLVIALEPRASLTGRVVDSNHAPVAGLHVIVTADHSDLDAGTIMFDRGALEGTATGDDGSFRSVGLGSGKVTVQVADARGVLAWSGRDKPNEPIPFDVVTGKETSAGTLVVEASAGAIRGTVVDGDGNPTADAWVTAKLTEAVPTTAAMMRARMLAYELDDTPPALTGADGKFVIDHLRHGTFELVAEGPRGMSRADKPGVAVGDTVTLTLASLGSISGHALAAGAPVTSFDLDCHGPIDASRHVQSDDGSYTLDRLAPGHYACAASADVGTGTGSADVPAGPAALDLAIVPFASVTGVVVSVLSGAPVPGLGVFAQGAAGQMGNIAAMVSGSAPMTDATGRFVVDKLGAGPGSVTIMGPGGALQAVATRAVTFVAGQRADLGIIKVVPPRTGDAGTLGMGTSVDGNALSVDSVSPGGPAQLAGIAVGDKITAIDGTPVADIGPPLAKTTLGSGTIGAGDTFALALDRAGTAVQVRVTAVKW